VSDDRRRVIDDLFDGALDQPEADRAAWLRSHCSDDQVRAEVEALLHAYDGSGGVLDGSALDVARPLLNASPTDTQIGPYRIRRELGRGGMGVVYLAERADGQYRRQVAIKLLRSSPYADELERRFIAERQILASLNHPNIAQLIDGGITEGRLPFLIMEYVDGVPITTYCDRQRLGIDERLQLFRDVCSAVHHAHQNLVIHRDIKPSNILVTQDRRVKLLDFGIAKLLNPTLGPADQAHTRADWRVMTPEYASPEQVRGESLTTASDVYALGVLLYELLCGRPPHRLTSGSPQELTDVIVHRDPLLPSVSVSNPQVARSDDSASPATPEAVAAERGASVERLQRRLEGDLDAIMMMALRKESARRYGSVDLLWEDIQRHLDGLPVLAHRPTRWYRVRKFIGRHRVETIAAAVVAISLIGGATVALRQASVASRERDRAEQALGQSREVTEFLVRLFRTPAAAGTSRDQLMAKDLIAAGAASIDELTAQPLVQAQMLEALGRVQGQLGQFEEAERMLRRALELRRANQGAGHVDVAKTLTYLSGLIRQRGKGDEAKQLIRDALGIQQAALGARHPDVAVTLSTLSELESDAAVSESLLRTVLDIQRAAFGMQHAAVATTLANLASERQRRGAFEEGESLLRQSVAIREQVFGPDHPMTATSMNLLANYLQDYRNQPVAAESLYRRSLVILRKQPPRWLPNVSAVLNGLLGVAAKRGDYAQAESLAREALDVQRRVHGPDHPVVADGLGLLAEQLSSQRRYADADTVLREAKGILERTVGPNHQRVARALLALARVRMAEGRLKDAEADLRRSLTIIERAQSPDDRWAGAVAALLGDVAARGGRKVEADEWFERSSSILRTAPRNRTPDMRAAYTILADHHKAAGRPADEAHFRKLAERDD
jgi:serine/threonine protein kinase/Flp pilus assembly protein TadD